MTLFRIFLVLIFTSIAAYTSIVTARYGLDILPIFFGDIGSLTWPGQFNLDFFCFLLLSGFWLAWRHHFSPAGLVLGIMGVFGGAPLLSAYLLIMSFKVNGDVKALLLGDIRANS